MRNNPFERRGKPPRTRKFPREISTDAWFAAGAVHHARTTVAAIDKAYNDGFEAGRTSMHMELSKLDGSKK